MREGWDLMRDRDSDDAENEKFRIALFSPREELNPSWETASSIWTELGPDIGLVDMAFELTNCGLYSGLFVLDKSIYLFLGAFDGNECVQASFYEFDRTKEFEILLPTHAGAAPFVPKNEFSFHSGTGPYDEVACQFIDFVLETLQPNSNDDVVVAWSGLCSEDEATWEYFVYNDYRSKIVAALDKPLDALRLDDTAHKRFTDIIVKLYGEIWDDLEISDVDEYEEEFPAIGIYQRARNFVERGPHILLRALADQRRATPSEKLHAFLYASAPEPIFREVVAFL